MPLCDVTGRYFQNDSREFPRSISWQQLMVLYVAANYMLRRSSMGCQNSLSGYDKVTAEEGIARGKRRRRILRFGKTGQYCGASHTHVVDRC